MQIHAYSLLLRELFLYAVQKKSLGKIMASDIKIEGEIGKSFTRFKDRQVKRGTKRNYSGSFKEKRLHGNFTTGYGKSLPYQMLLTSRREQKIPGPDLTNVGKIIVCSPIIALMQDQVDRLDSITNVKAVYKGRCYFVSKAFICSYKEAKIN